LDTDYTRVLETMVDLPASELLQVLMAGVDFLVDKPEVEERQVRELRSWLDRKLGEGTPDTERLALERDEARLTASVLARFIDGDGEIPEGAMPVARRYAMTWQEKLELLRRQAALDVPVAPVPEDDETGPTSRAEYEEAMTYGAKTNSGGE